MAKIHPKLRRVLIGIAGGVVLVVGIVAIPYPGPGWLIVFAGLGILATEFVWAQRLLKFAKGKYDSWQQWVQRQPLAIKLSVGALTALIVVVTLWLLNTYGIIQSILGLHQEWLISPFFR